jgi:hypothetical protein
MKCSPRLSKEKRERDLENAARGFMLSRVYEPFYGFTPYQGYAGESAGKEDRLEI